MLEFALALIAPDYLTEVQSETYQTQGTAAEITARADRCIAQQLGSGAAGGELIISKDMDGGTIVARNALSYRDGLLTWQMRSRVTFEAREGRFRIGHTAIERFNDQSGGWSPVGKWRGSAWQKAESALVNVTVGIAECVMAPARATEDW